MATRMRLRARGSLGPGTSFVLALPAMSSPPRGPPGPEDQVKQDGDRHDEEHQAKAPGPHSRPAPKGTGAAARRTSRLMPTTRGDPSLRIVCPSLPFIIPAPQGCRNIRGSALEAHDLRPIRSREQRMEPGLGLLHEVLEPHPHLGQGPIPPGGPPQGNVHREGFDAPHGEEFDPRCISALAHGTCVTREMHSQVGDTCAGFILPSCPLPNGGGPPACGGQGEEAADNARLWTTTHKVSPGRGPRTREWKCHQRGPEGIRSPPRLESGRITCSWSGCSLAKGPPD